MEKNIALLVEYDGGRYDGWQRQTTTENTIQGKLESVLEKMTGTFQEVYGSGRTDAGVHARGQVANVHLDTDMTEIEIYSYLNDYLPEDIHVLAAVTVSDRFHSRLWAREKIYTYYIDMGKRTSVFQRKYVYTLGEQLEIESMKQAAQILLGTHNFGSFCTGKSKKKSMIRTIKSIEMTIHKSLLEIRVTGDGFMHNMVRIIVGTLIEVGQGRRTAESIKVLLEVSDRRQAGFTVPAKGLFLTKVIYDMELFAEGVN